MRRCCRSWLQQQLEEGRQGTSLRELLQQAASPETCTDSICSCRSFWQQLCHQHAPHTQCSDCSQPSPTLHFLPAGGKTAGRAHVLPHHEPSHPQPQQPPRAGTPRALPARQQQLHSSQHLFLCPIHGRSLAHLQPWHREDINISACAGGRLGSWDWEAAEVPVSRKVREHCPVSGFS